MSATTALTKKAGPLPVWAWAAIAGGSIGVILLIKHKGTSSSSTSTETEAEAGRKRELEELVQGMENAASGGLNTPVTPEAQQNAGIETAPSSSQPATNPVETPVTQTPANLPLTSKSAVPFGARNPLRETTTGKTGPEYKPGKYKGLAAHIYDAAVKGGVGPGKNIIVLNPGKKTHAKKGQHEPAHAKDKTPTRSHVTTRTPRTPATVKVTSKAPAGKPKQKIAARAPAKAAPKKKVK